MNNDQPPTLRIDPRMRLDLPLITLLALISISSIAYALFYGTRDQVVRNTSEISDMKKAQQYQNDILIRIDENVKQLKSQK